MSRRPSMLTVEQQQARLAELDQLSRQRSLTEREVDEVEALQAREYSRLRRLPDQIKVARDRLTRLEGMAHAYGIRINAR